MHPSRVQQSRLSVELEASLNTEQLACSKESYLKFKESSRAQCREALSSRLLSTCNLQRDMASAVGSLRG